MNKLKERVQREATHYCMEMTTFTVQSLTIAFFEYWKLVYPILSQYIHIFSNNIYKPIWKIWC